MEKIACDFCGIILSKSRPRRKTFGTWKDASKPEAGGRGDFPIINNLKFNYSELTLCADCAAKTAKWVLRNLAVDNPSKREERE